MATKEKKAKESAQVKKARRKLKAQMDAEKEKFDETALRKVKAAMQRWISRNSMSRVKLEDKSIALFDENRNPAKVQSKFVKSLFGELQGKTKASDSLRGRIHRTEEVEETEENS